MPTDRPFVLSIAGFDPSGGAGVLADIKTFEQHQVYGLAIITGNTLQTEHSFQSIQWTELSFILESITVLFQNYAIKAVKIGIVPSLDYLKTVVETIRKLSKEVKIIWDTVLKSTSAFEFTSIENQSLLWDILKKVEVITPNYEEINRLYPVLEAPERLAMALSKYCAVLLKGGHRFSQKGFDYLYRDGKETLLAPQVGEVTPKHGSGCVLSSSITAHIALGKDLQTACLQAKRYIETYLQSNSTLLGYHDV